MRGRTNTIPWPGWLLAAAIIAALAAVFILTAPPAAQAHEADDHEFSLRCFPGTDNDNTSLTVQEGEDFDLQAKWHKRSGIGKWIAEWDTNETDPVSAQGELDFEVDDEEVHKKSRLYSTFNHRFHTYQDERWEGDERFEAGYAAIRKEGSSNHPAHYCTVTIQDDDPLKVTASHLWTDPANGKNYTVGESIYIRQNMSGNVAAKNTTSIILQLTDADGTTHERSANYNEILSTADRPVFAYEVQARDPAASKIAIKGGYHHGTMYGIRNDGWVTDLVPNWSGTATVKSSEQRQGTNTGPDQFGVDGRPKVSHINLTSQPKTDHAVTDTNALGRTYDYVISENTYRASETVEITAIFNQDVVVNGQVGVSLRIGSSNSWRGAWYESGSGHQHPEVQLHRQTHRQGHRRPGARQRRPPAQRQPLRLHRKRQHRLRNRQRQS